MNRRLLPRWPRTAAARSAAVLVLAAGAPAACTAPDSPGPLSAADSLARTELGFAAAARQDNVRDAFLAHIAEDGILFRPGPVHGRDALEHQQPGPELLAWRPIYAEAAASGDLGFTTGPWSFRPRRDTAEVAFGHFVTVWKKQADGAWRFVLDIGVSTMPDTAYPHDVETRQGDATPVAASVEDLMQRERSLSEAAARDGYPAALIAALDARGVQTARYLPCIHLQPYMRERYGFAEGLCPVAESLARRTLALPFHTAIAPADQERVVQVLGGALA